MVGNGLSELIFLEQEVTTKDAADNDNSIFLQRNDICAGIWFSNERKITNFKNF